MQPFHIVQFLAAVFVALLAVYIGSLLSVSDKKDVPKQLPPAYPDISKAEPFELPIGNIIQSTPTNQSQLFETPTADRET